MAENAKDRQPVSWSVDSDPDGLEHADFDSRDWALTALLDLGVEIDRDSSISLTVLVSGMLISGTAINRMRWRESFIGQMRSAEAKGNAAGILADAMDSLIGGPLDQTAELFKRRYASGIPRPAPHYLHFQDARVYTATPLEFPLFRVLLEDVSAWSLGSVIA